MAIVTDVESNMIEVINISSERAVFVLDDYKYVLKPRETAKIHKNYGQNRQLQEGKDPIPSVIELETNGKVLPVTDKRARSIVTSLKQEKRAE